MFLNRIATWKAHEPFEEWDDATQAFVPSEFRGRIDLTDRFLSNFNKPLRRRMLYSGAEQTMPASRVIRHPGTGDVYMLGQTRGDAVEGQHYLNLTVCHLVTETPNGSSGLATLYRRAPVGPEDNPGWLVEQQLGSAFVDMEFRTSASEPEMYEEKIANFFAFLPAHYQLKEWDFIELRGTRYRVVDTFADSGLAGLRIDREPDTRVDLVIQGASARQYDKVNHRFVDTAVSANVTAVIVSDHGFSSWAAESTPYLDISIEQEHIGFEPKPDMAVVLDGVSRLITSVSKPPLARQYRVRCK